MTRYYLAENTLLKVDAEADRTRIEAWIGGQWQVYPGITRDWIEHGVEITEGVAQRVQIEERGLGDLGL